MNAANTMIALAAGLLLFSPIGRAQNFGASPFAVSPSIVHSNGARFASMLVRIPADHHIYAERVSFEVNGAIANAQLPEAKRVPDKFNGGERLAFERDFQALCPLAGPAGGDIVLAVNFQGCNESECFFPETRRWKIGADDSVVAMADGDADGTIAAMASRRSDAVTLTNGFHIAGRASGYLSAGNFLNFIEASRSGKGVVGEELALARFGMAATLGLILLGGLALNLTPCVLPMIPINLAILGAGARHQNRRRGFALGSAYGGGMALAYGALGLVVVLTGSKFGALNSSAWFNFGIAALFVVLGLAMFDKLAIDFSRFQRRSGGNGSARGALFTAAAMGAVSALLAGACVAPVVISVLLLATTFYQQGNLFGLLLPFVLGLGMAIPWPFAAAGLSFLPKPGAWMTRVKYAFGVIIFAFALWYGWIGWKLADFGRNTGVLAAARSSGIRELEAALDQSRVGGRPVVVDFWAGWCKNCEAMEHTTFRDAAVRARIEKDFTLVKFQAERLNDPAIKPVLDQFGVMGLPTYVVLLPDGAAKP